MSHKAVKAEQPAYRWVCYADGRYITARFLFWKGAFDDFALIGAHAFEMYLKAYIVDKTGSFPPIHDLSKLCKTCGGHDPFFDTLLESPKWSRTWPIYWEFLRYPESLAGVDRPTLMEVGLDTVQQLDGLAYYVKSAVPNQAPAGSVFGDVIQAVTKITLPIPMLVPVGTEAELVEFRSLFLQQNQHFSPSVE